MAQNHRTFRAPYFAHTEWLKVEELDVRDKYAGKELSQTVRILFSRSICLEPFLSNEIVELPSLLLAVGHHAHLTLNPSGLGTRWY